MRVWVARTTSPYVHSFTMTNFSIESDSGLWSHQLLLGNERLVLSSPNPIVDDTGRVSPFDWSARESDGPPTDFINRFNLSLHFLCWNEGFRGISTKQNKAYDDQTYASSNGMCFTQKNKAEGKIRVQQPTITITMYSIFFHH